MKIVNIILKFWVKPWFFDGFCAGFSGETSIFGDPQHLEPGSSAETGQV
jgi:hypothetical protein